MDLAYANALKRRAELERAIARIDAFLELYREFSGSKREQIEPPLDIQAKDAEPQTHASGRLRPPQIADVVAEMIREEGRPLKRSEIVSGLESRGVEIGSPDKARYVGTILWRDRARFVNVPGEGYKLENMASLTDKMNSLARADDGEREDDKNSGQNSGIFD